LVCLFDIICIVAEKPAGFKQLLSPSADGMMKSMQILPSIAIDFGSYQLRAGVNDPKQPIFSCRSLLVRRVVSGEVVAVGDEAAARDLAAGEELVSPVNEGILTDYRGGVELLRAAFSAVLPWWGVFKPRVVLAESLQLSSAVSRALGAAAQEAGASKVYMTAVPALAALGSGIDPTSAAGNFVLDIGSHTTEAGVVARGSLVTSAASQVGGRDLLAAICLHIMDTYQVQVEPTVAREILHTVTAALRRDSQKTHEFYATTSAETEPQKILVSSNEIAEVIKKPLQKVAAVAGSVIKQTPTTLLSDIAENGLAVSGGVAELDYIDTFLQRELAVPVRVVEMPAEAVIRGGRKALSFISKYEQSIPVSEVNHA